MTVTADKRVEAPRTGVRASTSAAAAFAVDPARVEAHGVLLDGLAGVVRAGAEVPCHAPGASAWLSDKRAEQGMAAALCRRGCPLLGACRAYVAAWPEPAGTWAGLTEWERAEAAAAARRAARELRGKL